MTKMLTILLNIILIVKIFRYIGFIIVADDAEKKEGLHSSLITNAVKHCVIVICLLIIVNAIIFFLGIKEPMLILLFIFGIFDIFYNYIPIISLYRGDPVFTGAQEDIISWCGIIGVILDMTLMIASFYSLLGIFGVILSIFSIIGGIIFLEHLY